MSTRQHCLALLAGISLLSFTALAGDDAPATTTKKADWGRPSQEELLKKFDADGDGKLSDAEKAAAHAAHKARFEDALKQNPELLKKFDTDGDGALNDVEKAAALKQWYGARPEGGADEMLKKFDKNGDGVLDEAEKAEAKKAREAGHARYEEMLKKYDKNGDGKLDEAEKAAAKEAMQGGEGPLPDKYKKFDTNGDGKIDEAENAAAKEAMKDQMPKPGADRPAGKGFGKDK